jgi:beta-N-acetylhexosaminidase
LIAIDQEGGRIQRLRDPWTQWPPMQRLGDTDDLEMTAAVARALAVELLDLGIGLDFAPCVDVDTNPANPIIGDRSFGSEPTRVAAHAARFVRAMQDAGVAACAKHFPGHGDTTCDSHLELPRLDHDLARLRAVELPPFVSAIQAGVASIMTAHVLFPALDAKRPATLSPDVMAILREELAYDGVVFSDDLEMKAVADHHSPKALVDGCLEADVDSLLVCKHPGLREEVLRRLERAPDARLENPLRRMIDLKERFAGLREPFASADRKPLTPPYAEHRALAGRFA